MSTEPTEPSESFQFATLPGGREVGQFAPLKNVPGVVHAVTTRKGGLFPADVEDGGDMYEQLAGELGCSDAAWCRQVHGARVLAVDRGGGAGQADGLVSATPGLALLGFSADCPLILAADASGKAVGIAHASWQATVGRIAERLIAAMGEHFGTNPTDVIACVGPSAGPDRYEVGADVYDAAIAGIGPDAKNFFIRTTPTTRTTSTDRPDKWLFDLWSANASQLMGAGVEFMNLYTARICTMQRNDLFPSYRIEGDTAGRFAGIVGLKS